ncbi:MAG: hypothetical protein H6696_17335 [Deferribacteres bacterium]|nr:hypothetical protein [candidate division KSB1 bacterium]MCB9503700.1 hypothetical protein [Deferribacteres bacterium]
MNKSDYDKKLLQEKIAAHRRILSLEMKHVKHDLHPARAARTIGKSMAPQLLSLPVIKYIAKGKNRNLLGLILVAGAGMLLPFLRNKDQRIKKND